MDQFQPQIPPQENQKPISLPSWIKNQQMNAEHMACDSVAAALTRPVDIVFSIK